MQIIEFPNPKLFEKSRPVTVFGPELKILLESMWETMIKARGVGLSANQVDLDLKMFVMEGPNKEKLFIVNPIITKKSLVSANIKEGCLSAPGEIILIRERADWVEMKFQDETGAPKRLLLEGIHSVCVQHEIDHLNGLSFLEYKSIPKKTRIELAKKWGLDK